MRLTSSRRFGVVVAAASLGAAVLIYRAWLYTDSVTVQSGQGSLDRFTALSTAAAAIGGIFAFVVLVIYTRETYLLRKTAEQQLEAAEKPVLLFGLSSKDSQLAQPIELLKPTVRNIGSGPAFNVVVEPMKGKGVEVEFQLPNGSYIEGKQQLPLKFSITQDGQAGGMAEYLPLLADLIQKDEFPADMIVTVQFDSISGKKYRSRNRVRYDAMKKLVSTGLVPPVEELTRKEESLQLPKWVVKAGGCLRRHGWYER